MFPPWLALGAALVVTGQQLSVLSAYVYADGLMQLSLTPAVAALLPPCLSPLLLALEPAKSDGFRPVLKGAAAALGAASLAVPLLRFRSNAATIAVACAGASAGTLALPAYLCWASAARGARRCSRDASAALPMATLVVATLRALDNTRDAALAGGLFELVTAVGFGLGALATVGAMRRPLSETVDVQPAGLPEVLLAAVGWWACVWLHLYAFSAPAALSRWGTTASEPVVIVLAIVCALAVGFASHGPPVTERGSRLPVFAAYAAFAVVFVFAGSPTTSADVRAACIYASVALYPAVCLAFATLTRYIVVAAAGSHPRRVAWGAALGVLGLQLLVVASVLTITYSYVPGVGPSFRDAMPEVNGFGAVAAVGAAAVIWRPLRSRPVDAVPRLLAEDEFRGSCGTAAATEAFLPRDELDRPDADPSAINGRAARTGFASRFKSARLAFVSQSAPVKLLGLSVTSCVIFTCAGVLLQAPDPVSPTIPPTGSVLKLVTYNVQQGYDMDALPNFDAVYEALQDISADVVALQESSTERLTALNDDLVRYLADSLNMHSYFGPPTVRGTYGVALLSRFPIRSASTFYLESEFEQVAAVDALLQVGPVNARVFVTHLGADSDVVGQASDLADRIADAPEPNVFMLCDCNFEPLSEGYNATVERSGLVDTWAQMHPTEPGYTETWRDPRQRIDYVFGAPAATPMGVYVETSAHASDHMPVVAMYALQGS